MCSECRLARLESDMRWHASELALLIASMTLSPMSSDVETNRKRAIALHERLTLRVGASDPACKHENV